MSFIVGLGVVGALLLFMALSSSFLQKIFVSSALVYLTVGVAVGPVGLGWLRIDLEVAAPWLERLTEVAVTISLFISGLKLRAPIRSAHWRAALMLAGPVMLMCICGVAVFAHLTLGLGVASALLLGAMLAPTDPVLASAIAVNSASDLDRMRYGLSGEAGLNDGAAFPFVVLALMWMQHDGPGAWLGVWALHRLLWAIPAALALGYFAGRGIGLVAIATRKFERSNTGPNDFLALALIALSYAAADLIGAWGFLAAFAAGLGLRRAELQVVKASPHPEAHKAPVVSAGSEDSDAGLLDVAHPPAERLVHPAVDADRLDQPAVAAGALVADVLSFGDTAERLLEVTLMVMIGACLVTHWDARAVPLALMLFVALRPMAANLFLLGSPTSSAQRTLMAWFGIRGIGSLYYLAYALNHGIDRGDARVVVNLTVSVVALSVLLHGASSQPLLQWYSRLLEAKQRKRAPA
ncbi:MAG: cation:proton antiporter [Deltaproteobacteria bacterium]|nr:cation:proton antiporter [Deltaproteobacteria bacterium]